MCELKMVSYCGMTQQIGTGTASEMRAKMKRRVDLYTNHPHFGGVEAIWHSPWEVELSDTGEGMIPDYAGHLIVRKIKGT